jgi:hypothetical protein
MATPTNPDDPIPEEAQKYVHTEVKISEGGDNEDDNADNDEDEDDVPAVQDR